MAKNRKARIPSIGECFNPEQMTIGDAFNRLADILEEYRPRKYRSVRNDLREGAIAYDSESFTESARDDLLQLAHDAASEAESILTEMAQSRTRNPYVYFCWDGDFCGFRVNVDSAIEDADWIEDDSPRGRRDEVPPRTNGLLIHISDHGNVSAYAIYANGRRRELFAVV